MLVMLKKSSILLKSLCMNWQSPIRNYKRLYHSMVTIVITDIEEK